MKKAVFVDDGHVLRTGGGRNLRPFFWLDML